MFSTAAAAVAPWWGSSNSAAKYSSLEIPSGAPASWMGSALLNRMKCANCRKQQKLISALRLELGSVPGFKMHYDGPGRWSNSSFCGFGGHRPRKTKHWDLVTCRGCINRKERLDPKFAAARIEQKIAQIWTRAYGEYGASARILNELKKLINKEKKEMAALSLSKQAMGEE